MDEEKQPSSSGPFSQKEGEGEGADTQVRPYPDGPEMARDKVQALNAAPWDGKEVIQSPFVEGDFLRVRPRVRVSGWDSQRFWEYPFVGASPEDNRQMIDLLGRVFSEVHLTGLDGTKVEDWQEFRSLSVRSIAWAINRAIQVVLFNPLA